MPKAEVHRNGKELSGTYLLASEEVRITLEYNHVPFDIKTRISSGYLQMKQI